MIHKFYNEENEKCFLGCCLQDTFSCINLAIQEDISSDHFWSPNHQAIWKEIYRQFIKTKQFDLPTLIDRLKRGNRTNLIVIIEKCIDATPTTTKFSFYLQKLKVDFEKRNAYKTTIQFQNDLVETEDINQVFADYTSNLLSISSKTEKERSISEIAQDIHSKYKNEGKNFQHTRSRFHEINMKTKGYMHGQLHVHAARPGKGKTSFMMNEASYEMDVLRGRPAIVTIEMDEEQLVEKMICERQEINTMSVADYLEKFRQGETDLANKELFINDRANTINKMAAWLRRMKFEKGITSAWVDYLQIIGRSDYESKMSDVQFYSYVCHELRMLAKELKTPVHLMSQINRSGEAPNDSKAKDKWKHVPKLHHLKATGSLEEDAFTVVLMYERPIDKDTSDWGTVPYIFDIAKARKGKVGLIHNIKFQKTIGRFNEVEAFDRRF